MFSDGVTVLGVPRPGNPRPVNYLPAAPGTWNLHLADGLLLVVNAVNMFAAEAFAPREVGAFVPPAPARLYDLQDEPSSS
jgi:hypothetical protein